MCWRCFNYGLTLSLFFLLTHVTNLSVSFHPKPVQLFKSAVVCTIDVVCKSRFCHEWSNLTPSMEIISNSRDLALSGDESGRSSFVLVTDKISDERQKENRQHKNYRFLFIGKILFLIRNVPIQTTHAWHCASSLKKAYYMFK